MYKVTIGALFIDGKKHVRGDMVDLSVEKAAAYSNNLEPCEAPKAKSKPKAKAKATPRKKKASTSEG